MDDVAVVRALHVLAVVFWIGGVGFVTTVILPATVSYKKKARGAGRQIQSITRRKAIIVTPKGWQLLWQKPTNFATSRCQRCGADWMRRGKDGGALTFVCSTANR